ncbi:hypothetical protein CYMTET_3856 [Cymbomonas tetramitiformis]|uniref:Crossover junction endonuclease MUS81 n=1 Tax=Cymbomonas tetramitiformis TaxID=36881 RepID=A0AAE0H2B9_9CHLO|nr:hypothetical protein CYMTET_3856 [Cymbomonas tetramitiformis]|eukprot:gene30888-38716_t
MRDIKLLVDSREPKGVRDALRSDGVLHTIATLDVGDFHFLYGTKLLLTVERKTWSDLESARITGRFEDQLKRALTNACERNAMHVILVEDSTIRSDEELRKDPKVNRGIMAASALNRCVLQRGVGVLRSRDSKDTARLLDWIKRKCENECLLPEIDAGEAYGKRTIEMCNRPYHGGVIHAKKRKNEDNPEACWVNMLTVIRGSSEKIARSIAAEYCDAAALISSAEEGSASSGKANVVSRADALLERIPVLGSNRRVGPALARRITACLMGSRKEPNETRGATLDS